MTTSRTKDMLHCALFTALIAVGAFIRIPLPHGEFFTLQLIFVILAGLLLGPTKGFIAGGMYLLIGLLGFPIFAAGGGIGYVLRPTFGYLLGFVVAAWLTGFLSRRFDKASFPSYLVAALCGAAVIYFCGLTYKYILMNFFLGQPLPLPLLFLSVISFEIPKDILSCCVASMLCLKVKPVLTRHQWV